MSTIEITIPANVIVVVDGNQYRLLRVGDKEKISGDTDIHTPEGRLVEIKNPSNLVVERAVKRKHTHVIRIHRE